jgi:predicted DNA-binding transcriptional regulator
MDDNQFLKVLQNTRYKAVILALLAKAEPMRRREIATETKIAESAVSLICKELLQNKPDRPAILNQKIIGFVKTLQPSEYCLTEMIKLRNELEQSLLPNLKRFQDKIAEHSKK